MIEMRKWQKEYFQTRSRRALDQAKHFEREVDKQLAAASALVVDTIVEGVGKVINEVEERYAQQQMEIGFIVDDVFTKEDACFEDDDSFQCCDNCDLPDACYDYGCAIKLGLRRDKGF